MAAADSNRPIIIKRKKVSGGDGHHGGAWKVAYADFVTAMMAFFLLMWLLNATTEEQRKGLSDYFDPKAQISRVSGGGSGLFGGDSIFSENVKPQNGTGGTDIRPADEAQSRGDQGMTEGEAARDAENEGFAEVESLLAGLTGESDLENELLAHIRSRVTDEGLIIDLFDTDAEPLFGTGSALPSLKMVALLEMIGAVSNMIENDIAIAGHTDASPFSSGGYSNWELSSDRAQTARRTLEEAGVATGRIQRVTGEADRDLALPEEPLASENRRIEIIFLRSDLPPQG